MQERILVVDDELDMLDLIAYSLRIAHFEVFTAANGQEALNQARAVVPDLIVLDVMLPDLDGFSVCELLQRLPSTAATPVLMLTAVVGEIPRCHALASGAKSYMTKPFRVEELLQTIRYLLANRTEPDLDPDPHYEVIARALVAEEVR